MSLSTFPPVRMAELERQVAQLEAEVQRLGLEGLDLRRRLFNAEQENDDLRAFAASVTQEGAGRLPLD